MALQSSQKMSLVVQYDDLCRYTRVLTSGSEEEFKMFIANHLNSLQKLRESQAEVEKLNEKVSNLKFENRRLETQIKHMKDLVEDAVNKRKKVEFEKNTLERQIALIKDVLLADGVMDNQTKEKLGFLSSLKASMNSPPRLETIEETTGSVLSLSDVDRTEDDLDLFKYSFARNASRSNEKRSISESKIVLKKKKLDSFSEESLSDTNENVNFPYKPPATRSSSEPASSPEKPTIFHPTHKSDSAQFQSHPYELRRSSNFSGGGGTPVGRYSTGGKLSRTHLFVVKTLYRPEKCHPCRHTIGFIKQALKCKDCRVICHPECKEKCPLPCIPVVNTPTKGSTGTIADYTSSAPPMIPPLIVHCVNEIESRGLRDIGLYRVPGSEREVKDLRDKLLSGRSVPSLCQSDVHAVCGTIKEFLRSLREPLVTLSAKQDLACAADLSDDFQSLNAVFDVVVNLPQPNRDTLAFLILHLQRVADSPDCKMPIKSLVNIFGPTIVGYSSAEPDKMTILKETKDQCKIMERLLSISSDSWQSLLNVEPDVFFGKVKTPETIQAPTGTLLGPFFAPGQKSRTLSSGKTPLSSRNSKFNRSGKLSFSSPLLR